ncbi:MAG: VOC family protein [Ignavibacteriales bacterium]|nr:VOC family protein [Ignavibacteriales bacterium]
MQKITPCLWFDNNAEEAIHFYTSIFKNSKIGSITCYGEGTPFPKGTLLAGTFQLDGNEFIALNGGPMYNFTPAISLSVDCQTQAEVDEYWEKLSNGGSEERCGWLKDKYGVSWQIVPSILIKMLGDPDPEKVKRVASVMLQMIKLDINILQKAYEES